LALGRAMVVWEERDKISWQLWIWNGIHCYALWLCYDFDKISKRNTN
jgi:hypothetical protein